jgi:hypothetical protein
VTVTEAILREPSARQPRPHMTRLVTGISRGMDSLGDFAVLGFAAWTVLYHVGLIFDLPTDALLIAWFASLAGVLWYTLRPSRDRTAASADGSGVSFTLSMPLMIVAVGLAMASGIVLAFGGSGLWWTGWALAVAAAAVGVVSAVRTRATATAAPQAIAVPAVGTVLALLTSVGFAVLSVFTLHSDADDTFYVNRAAWVADHGTIAVRDTIFTDQRLPAIRGAGVPVASIETLQGAIAHAFQLAGGTVVYLVTPPVGTLLAMWSLWRLTRSWAQRRLGLCYAAAIVALLWSGAGPAEMGLYILSRMQQGKVIFLAMLIPLIYLYLTEWTRRRESKDAVMLAASGVAAVGFTSSATFLVPLICATVVVPLLLCRDVRTAAGAALPAVYPVAVGIVVHFTYSAIDPHGTSYTAAKAMHYVCGTGGLALVGWTAVFTAVWLARDSAARLVTAGIGAGLVVVLAPGVLALMNDATGAHAVLWRTVWIAPIPVMVGLLASVPLPSRIAWAGAVPAAGLIVALVLVGLPFWAAGNRVSFTSMPTWRYLPAELHRARQIADRKLDGPVLAPPSTMRALDLVTTRVHAVSPKLQYVPLVTEPAADRRARLLLARVIGGALPNAPPAAIRGAMNRLHVSLVCGLNRMTHREKLFTEAGYVAGRGISGGWCLVRPR